MITVGAATDYLYGLAQAAVAGVTVNGEPVLVSDGWPDELALGMFLVGLSDSPPEGSGQTSGTDGWPLLGNPGAAAEDYLIPCVIDVRISGNVQKTARDLAESMFNTFWDSFVTDRSLGDLLHGGGATITSIVSIPSNVGTVAEPGRRQLISFAVRCTNLSA